MWERGLRLEAPRPTDGLFKYTPACSFQARYQLLDFEGLDGLFLRRLCLYLCLFVAHGSRLREHVTEDEAG